MEILLDIEGSHGERWLHECVAWKLVQSYIGILDIELGSHRLEGCSEALLQSTSLKLQTHIDSERIIHDFKKMIMLSQMQKIAIVK